MDHPCVGPQDEHRTNCRRGRVCALTISCGIVLRMLFNFVCPVFVYLGALDQDCKTALAGWTGRNFFFLWIASILAHKHATQ